MDGPDKVAVAELRGVALGGDDAGRAAMRVEIDGELVQDTTVEGQATGFVSFGYWGKCFKHSLPSLMLAMSARLLCMILGIVSAQCVCVC